MQINAIQPTQSVPLITLKNINVVFEQKTALRILILTFILIQLLPLSVLMVGENQPF